MSGLLNLDDVGTYRLAIPIGGTTILTFTLPSAPTAATVSFRYLKTGAADLQLTSAAGDISIDGTAVTVTISAANSGTMTAGKPYWDLTAYYGSVPVVEIDGYARFKTVVSVP